MSIKEIKDFVYTKSFYLRLSFFLFLLDYYDFLLTHFKRVLTSLLNTFLLMYHRYDTLGRYEQPL
jgi:hypothetical protein